MSPGGGQMKKGSVWLLGGIASGIILLALMALSQGPPELMALATVLTAGAALLSSITRKEK
jgi:hypothetical protein